MNFSTLVDIEKSAAADEKSNNNVKRCINKNNCQILGNSTESNNWVSHDKNSCWSSDDKVRPDFYLDIHNDSSVEIVEITNNNNEEKDCLCNSLGKTSLESAAKNCKDANGNVYDADSDLDVEVIKQIENEHRATDFAGNKTNRVNQRENNSRKKSVLEILNASPSLQSVREEIIKQLKGLYITSANEFHESNKSKAKSTTSKTDFKRSTKISKKKVIKSIKVNKKLTHAFKNNSFQSFTAKNDLLNIGLGSNEDNAGILRSRFNVNESSSQNSTCGDTEYAQHHISSNADVSAESTEITGLASASTALHQFFECVKVNPMKNNLLWYVYNKTKDKSSYENLGIMSRYPFVRDSIICKVSKLMDLHNYTTPINRDTNHYTSPHLIALAEVESDLGRHTRKRKAPKKSQVSDSKKQNRSDTGKIVKSKVANEKISVLRKFRKCKNVYNSAASKKFKSIENHGEKLQEVYECNQVCPKLQPFNSLSCDSLSSSIFVQVETHSSLKQIVHYMHQINLLSLDNNTNDRHLENPASLSVLNISMRWCILKLGLLVDNFTIENKSKIKKNYCALNVLNYIVYLLNESDHLKIGNYSATLNDLKKFYCSYNLICKEVNTNGSFSISQYLTFLNQCILYFNYLNLQFSPHKSLSVNNIS